MQGAAEGTGKRRQRGRVVAAGTGGPRSRLEESDKERREGLPDELAEAPGAEVHAPEGARLPLACT